MPDETPELRVLVIDDSVDNAEALCLLLAALGCVTTSALSGPEGIAVAAKFSPHLVFIDLEMPGMGGCDVARQLRASYPEDAMKLVCLTGRGHSDDKRACMDAGFDDFFSKPISPESLTRVVAASNEAEFQDHRQSRERTFEPSMR